MRKLLLAAALLCASGCGASNNGPDVAGKVIAVYADRHLYLAVIRTPDGGRVKATGQMHGDDPVPVVGDEVIARPTGNWWQHRVVSVERYGQ